jgi:UDP:flavonoid glycosyltransferase YjiC (YdhE family)
MMDAPSRFQRYVRSGDLDVRTDVGKHAGMGTILFVGEAVSLAHVGRPAMLASWARDSGYEVVFATGAAYARIAREKGFDPLELPTIAPQTFYDRLAKGSFFYTRSELETYVHAELELFERLNPDLVVGDFRLSLAISTAVSAIPLLSLNNAHWSPGRRCPFPPPDHGFFGALPRPVRRALFALLRPAAFRFFAKSVDDVRQRFGLARLLDFRLHYTAGTWCAYLDLPELVPVETLPAGHFYLGPVVWQPDAIEAPRLDAPSDGRGLAYVSMGSSGDIRVLPAVIRALAALDYDIVISGISTEQASAMRQDARAWSERCIAAPFFNPDDVFERADVTVCHGGTGTIYQSLAAGVPLLCLPGNPDQSLMSEAVVKDGSGLAVEASKVTERNIGDALMELRRNPRYRSSAMEKAVLIKSFDARRRWSEFLQRVLQPYSKVGSNAGSQGVTH